MTTLEAIRGKIDSAQDLQSVVKTMKGLAAANIWQYERTVNALADYSRTIELGLQIALRNESANIKAAQPPTGEQIGMIVFGSDQGMVGRFNEVIVRRAFDTMNELQIKKKERHILAVGLRVAAQLKNVRQPLEETFPVPGSLNGVTPLVQDMLLHIEAWRERQGIDQILIFYNKPLSGASYEPQMLQLLPLDLVWLQQLKDKTWPTRTLPTYRIGWEQLMAALIRQYFFVLLYRAFVESLASENASRLASMQGAEKNIEERLDTLNSQFHRQRQQSITEELLDVVAGSEALSS